MSRDLFSPLQGFIETQCTATRQEQQSPSNNTTLNLNTLPLSN